MTLYVVLLNGDFIGVRRTHDEALGIALRRQHGGGWLQLPIADQWQRGDDTMIIQTIPSIPEMRTIGDKRGW